uniref:FAD-dependent oxidoreductase domain-containing protein 1 n=1 Tax=Parastrongyloides trichosuri TaxID=131310 RepID=A0A0N4Z5L0_PARTI
MNRLIFPRLLLDSKKCIIPSVRNLQGTKVKCWQKFENERHYEPGEDVPGRIWHGLTYDFRRWRRRFNDARRDAWRRMNPIAHTKKEVQDWELLPYRAEVVIIGGGLSGSATAFWLKQRFRDEDFKVVVVENPDSFKESNTMLDPGSLTHQFSHPEFIEMSKFTSEFLRHAGEHLQILDSPTPDINLLPVGHMHLARNEEEANKLREMWKVQIGKSAKIAYYDKEELKSTFPFMNFEDVIAGTYGLEDEGAIDTWQLISAIREKNITLGVHYIKGEVEDFLYENENIHSTKIYNEVEEVDASHLKRKLLRGIIIKPKMTGASPRPIRSHMIVNAAGPWSGKIAELAGIGKGKGMMAVPVPVKPKKKMTYVIHAPDVPAVDFPALVDPSGIYVRPQDVGYKFIVEKSYSREEDKLIDHSNLNVDYDFFYNIIWPKLIERVPGFKNINIVNGWARYEDVNIFDDAPIIGEHLLYKNLFMMCGYGRYGMQFKLSAAKAFSERAYDGAYTSFNLRKYDMRRIMKNQPLKEPLKF